MLLSAQIEAILFFKGEPLSVKKLAELLAVRTETIEEALNELENKLAGGGLTLIRNQDEVMLATAAEAGELIESIKKEELSRDIGKAGLETLAIVLYKGPISRPDIDYIRGVNSSFILRNLLVRGLIERLPNPNDSRSYLYQPTFDLMSFLGLTRIEDLPEFDTLKQKVEEFTSQSAEPAEEEAEQNEQTIPTTNEL